MLNTTTCAYNRIRYEATSSGRREATKRCCSSANTSNKFERIPPPRWRQQNIYTKKTRWKQLQPEYSEPICGVRWQSRSSACDFELVVNPLQIWAVVGRLFALSVHFLFSLASMLVLFVLSIVATRIRDKNCFFIRKRSDVSATTAAQLSCVFIVSGLTLYFIRVLGFFAGFSICEFFKISHNWFDLLIEWVFFPLQISCVFGVCRDRFGVHVRD